MTTTATFIVEFGDVEDALLEVTLDEDRNGGKTKFVKGDPVHFRIYSNTLYDIEVSSGTYNTGLLDVAEPNLSDTLSFVKGASASASKKIKSINSKVWYDAPGNIGLGDLNFSSGTKEVQAALATVDTLGICTINYTSEYSQYTLVPPAEMGQTYNIIVYIKAKV